MKKQTTVLHAKSPGQENRSRSWMEHCPFPLLATEGETHRIVDANPIWCRMVGRSKESLLGCSMMEGIPEETVDGSLPALLDRVYHTGEAENGADQEPLDPGRSSVLRSYVVWAVRDEAQRPKGLVILGTDPLKAELREINLALRIAHAQQHKRAEAARTAEESLKASEEMNRQAAVLAERNRIAGEIHDTLAQVFTGILLQLRVALRIAGQRPEEAWGLRLAFGSMGSAGGPIPGRRRCFGCCCSMWRARCSACRAWSRMRDTRSRYPVGAIGLSRLRRRWKDSLRRELQRAWY